VVATVSKDAKHKVDGTDMGFKPLALISANDAASPAGELQDGAASRLSRCARYRRAAPEASFPALRRR
jgi:hypothetical protein